MWPEGARPRWPGTCPCPICEQTFRLRLRGTFRPPLEPWPLWERHVLAGDRAALTNVPDERTRQRCGSYTHYGVPDRCRGDAIGHVIGTTQERGGGLHVRLFNLRHILNVTPTPRLRKSRSSVFGHAPCVLGRTGPGVQITPFPLPSPSPSCTKREATCSYVSCCDVTSLAVAGSVLILSGPE